MGITSDPSPCWMLPSSCSGGQASSSAFFTPLDRADPPTALATRAASSLDTATILFAAASLALVSSSMNTLKTASSQTKAKNTMKYLIHMIRKQLLVEG
eukprot:CAMPEP_0173303364 /NCGR_PEP_ID=MMETSP1143-20121109/18859_1 /TAXON_ID=483371 /ORGANISM="non described non described, Strain CCMP2298" /LENGTH=98 /DNA_ID=CAMNT_0014244087 /DNA_START=1329 /DNA_END=1622 /DNA_ORIENTATION=+